MTQLPHGQRLGVDMVSRLVATQFPEWAHHAVVEVLPGGNDNRTFRLGDDLLVRLPSAAGYAAQVEKEHRWLPVLGPAVPLPIPVPVALGAAADGFRWAWSVYRWIDGTTISDDGLPDAGASACATALADFLSALHRVDPDGGPPPGEHNFYRGGPLATYDAETRASITGLGTAIAGPAALDVWDSALAAQWTGPPVWLHGDVAAGNLLLRDGQLAAVIDFGCCAVGDPACDLTIAWTVFAGTSRETFRDRLKLTDGTWARARGWALWKAAITLVQHLGSGSGEEAAALRVINDVIADHAAGPV